jgi:His-Xaa-Ser system protein HxsD
MALEQTTLTVDTSVYSKICIFRACYKFTESAYIFLSRAADAPDRIIVEFTAKPGGRALQEVIGEFSNELIDQALRETLDQRFGPIRDLIVAQSFAEGNLLNQLEEEGAHERR